MKLPEIVNNCFVEPVNKKYAIGFPESDDEFMQSLRFNFINHKDALMFARGFNAFNMEEMSTRTMNMDYITRGSQTAYLIQGMKLPLSKALLVRET
jgi:elongation factor P hydroxylase